MSRVTPVLLYSLTGAVVLSSLSSCKEKKSEEVKKTMNVVYIMCDDHSYQTISAYDQRYMQTPNIDRIASEGVRFTNSFVANSLSGPSRACMLTGKHSHANGFTDNTTTFDGNQQTFPKLLQANGYQTAMIGKWHLVSEPTGFDYWDILIGQGDYYNPKFIKNGERVQREGYATNIVTDLAINWMDSIRDKSKPFCLFIHHKAPHRTWMPDLCDLDLYDDVIYPMPENFYDKYEGRIPASKQEMSIIKDMDLVYDLKMADKENEIHTTTGLEEAGRNMYNALNPEQKAAWDKHYDPIIARFKKDKLTGKALAEWKYQQYMHDYMRVIHSVDRNVGRVLKYLEENGFEIIEARMTDVIRKTYFYQDSQIREYHLNKPMDQKIWFRTADMFFDLAHSLTDSIAKGHPLYKPAIRMDDLVKDSDPIIHHTFDAGEGVLIPGEIIHHAKHGCKYFLILQPFGCLPNHVVGRGISKKLKEMYPNAQILPLDYDPDVSFANIENRLQMLVMNAKQEILEENEERDRRRSHHYMESDKKTYRRKKYGVEKTSGV